MANTDGIVRTGSGAASAAAAPLLGRDRLARLVVVGSFLTLFLLVGALLALTQSENETASDAAQNAFNAILPVLAGWVGTVLAFYFSAASQERTAVSLDKAINQSGAGAASATDKPASEAMIPFASISELKKLDEKKAQDILLTDLRNIFTKVSRVLFVEHGVFKYIVHISTFNAFVVAQTQPLPDAETKKIPEPRKVEELNFTDMLKDEETLRQISKLVVFVDAKARLSDARQALDKVPGAQDIIVTASGNATEPMLGWLSNVDLIKAMHAS